MCGILGSVNICFDNSLLDSIKHRGPDDFGIEQYIFNHHEVLFGQRRLSIIDVSSAGHQPMKTSCDNYSIIFNGEIYNHQELREKLPQEIKFTGHSDTETILYYLKEYGIASIKDLNGIFSIAFLDRVHNKLFLARDPFGVKPLYYSEGENNFIFSSEIKPLKSIQAESTINLDALATLLRIRFNPSPDTLFNRIQKIRPGHYIEIDLNAPQLLIKHISYLKPLTETIHKPKTNVVPLYGQKLEDAVKRQLLSDVEIGILLSGGIDSALVAAIAKKHYNKTLKAFTIGFEGNHAEDEIEDAAETASILGLEHHYKRINFSDFLDIIKKCVLIVEEPLATTSIIPMFFLSEIASNAVKVVLTGQGADEPLGGYNRYKLELIRNIVPSFLTRLPQKVLSSNLMKDEGMLRGIKSLGIKDEIERFLSVYEIFNLSEIQKLISKTEKTSEQRISYFYEALDCKKRRTSLERMMALDTRLSLPDDLLNYTDKISMHFSMECRVPMLDLELVQFIESLPIKYKVNLNQGKIIHKQFAHQVLPDSIINRKKKAFQTPTAYWFKNEIETVKEILLKGNTEFSKVFNQQYVAEIIKSHQLGYNKEKQIFLLISIFYWLDQLN